MVFFAIVWFAWSSSQTTTGEGGMPLIKADNAPVKMRPEQPRWHGGATPGQADLRPAKAETGNTETAAVERLCRHRKIRCPGRRLRRRPKRSRSRRLADRRRRLRVLRSR